LKAFAFIPFGLGSTLSNAILIIAIMRCQQLRSRHEIQVICALAFADFIEGILLLMCLDVSNSVCLFYSISIKRIFQFFSVEKARWMISSEQRATDVVALATLIAGIYRSTVIIIESLDVLFTPLQCMLLPHSWAWRWSDFATSFMLLALTLDRLVSVLFPLKYISWGPTYPRIAIGLPFTLSLLLSLVAWYHPITMKGTLSMLCMNVYLSPAFYAASKYMTSCATTLSVILYVPVVFLIRKQLKQVSDKLYPTQVDYQRRAQLKMTITVAISSFLTLFLDAIPRSIGIYGE
uniref:G_PROTEIN_RECEP_F1_2 domain-containing protein n=1 Tax=Anisakis simplex TaxID=6269 RepID=A0A0M3JWG9_ANISI